MRVLIILFAGMIASAQAAEHVWTGAGSTCGDTLLQCVNNAAENDTIILKTNDVIAESLNPGDNSVSLVAADGYKPVFAAGHSITLTNYSGSLKIQGLTFHDGGISIINQATSGINNTVEIIRNKVTHLDDDGITVSQRGVDNLLNIDIKYNEVEVAGTSKRAIEIETGSTGNYLWDAFVYGNRIKGHSNTRGIFIWNQDNDGVYENLISGNTISGTNSGAISVFNQNTSSAEMTSYIVSNYCQNGRITVQSELASDGEMINHIYNNTIMGSQYGISILGQDGDAAMEYHLANNLIIDTEFGITANPSANNVMLTNETNMFQRVNGFNNYTVTGTNIPVADHINVVQSNYAPRLVAGSPAIDAATFVTAGPYVDADGLYRSKLGGIDIGAFEYGDTTFEHASSGGSYTSQISDASVNGQSTSQSIHITQNATQPEGEDFLYNYANAGIWYNVSLGKWNVFNQDTMTEIESGVKFNVIHIGESANTFEHPATGGIFSFSLLDVAQLNNNPDKVLQVSQHWTGVYNDQPEGIYYNPGLGSWYIYNLDNAAIPDGANYNVQYQDASKSAWVHTATVDNTSISATVLDNSLINGVPCAQIQVTQSATGGVFNNHPVAVAYSYLLEQWYIVQQRENLEIAPIYNMPIGAQFHVLINPDQIEKCNDLIFTNSFD